MSLSYLFWNHNLKLRRDSSSCHIVTRFSHRSCNCNTGGKRWLTFARSCQAAVARPGASRLGQRTSCGVADACKCVRVKCSKRRAALPLPHEGGLQLMQRSLGGPTTCENPQMEAFTPLQGQYLAFIH